MGFPSASGFGESRDVGSLIALDGVRGMDIRCEVAYSHEFLGHSVVRKGAKGDSTPVAADLRRPTRPWEGGTGMDPELAPHGGLRGMGSEARCLATLWEPESSLGIILR